MNFIWFGKHSQVILSLFSNSQCFLFLLSCLDENKICQRVIFFQHYYTFQDRIPLNSVILRVLFENSAIPRRLTEMFNTILRAINKTETRIAII